MAIEVRRVERDRIPELLGPVGVVFGMAPSREREDRVRAAPELDTLFTAIDDGQLVASGGAFAFDMTVPGGVAVGTSGLTLVSVLPTHRRQGILREMMRLHLDGARARGQAVAALYASEGSIYGRFGYGLASLRGDGEIRRERTTFVGSLAGSFAGGFVDGARDLEGARVRLVGEEEAARLCAPVWERVRLTRPGMLTRSSAWWRARRVGDPEGLRAGRPPLQRAVLELDGRTAAYALYRFGAPVFASAPNDVSIEVMECLADSVAATRAIWRFVFSIDLARTFRVGLFPTDHPLTFLLAEQAALPLRFVHGQWVRLVDVGAALSTRRYAVHGGGDGEIVFDVKDEFCAWNTGRWRLCDGAASRTDAPADLALDVGALGSTYLGAFGFTQLAGAGLVTELRPGALARGDAMFRGRLAPWCPEIF
jgi:predicted acetyltransferase